MKRIISAIIIVTLFAMLCPAALAVDNMAEAIKDLSSYLSNAEAVQIDIDEVIDEFGQFGNKDKAVEFKFYSMMVKNIVEEKWDDALRYAKVLEQMDFDKYIGSEVFEKYMESFGVMNNNYSNIRPISEVRHYIAGRRAESEGRMDEALDEYLQSYSFFDGGIRLEQSMGISTDSTGIKYARALEYYGEGNLDEALRLLVDIKDKDEQARALYDILILEVKANKVENTPEPVVSAPAETNNANLPTLRITQKQLGLGITTIYWNEIEGATKYTLYQRTKNGDKKELYSGLDTKGKDDTVYYGNTYYYTVVATLSDGREVSSEEVQIIAATAAPANKATPAPASNPTPAPAKEPTHTHNWTAADCTHPKTCTTCGATEGSALGHDWKAADCTHAKTCSRCGATEGSALGHDWKPATESAPKTCSRCGATEGSKLTWGEWSNWSSTSVSASSTRQVETRTVYYYYRWHYYNTKHNSWYNHYNEYTGSEYKAGSGEWQYKTTTEPLDYAGTVSGHKYYSGYWYLQSTGTEYRYRDLK